MNLSIAPLLYINKVCRLKEYYPFGMVMPGRIFSSDNYRFGFENQEVDQDVSGANNHIAFAERSYDPRKAAWWSPDPEWAKYPGESPYSFASNNPIYYIDDEGRTRYSYIIVINEQTNERKIVKIPKSNDLVVVARKVDDFRGYVYDWHDVYDISVYKVDKNGKITITKQDNVTGEKRITTNLPFGANMHLSINGQKEPDKNGGTVWSSKNGAGPDNIYEAEGKHVDRIEIADQLLRTLGIAGSSNQQNIPDDLLDLLGYLVGSSESVQAIEETISENTNKVSYKKGSHLIYQSENDDTLIFREPSSGAEPDSMDEVYIYNPEKDRYENPISRPPK